MNNAPFFIVGSGRSGSTWLRMMLASHSRLAIPPETWFLNRMPDLLELGRPLTSKEAERALDIMTGHYRWPDFQIDASAFRRQVAQLARPHLREIVELVYAKHVERDGKRRWGDKTPGYIALAPQLVRLFPGAKFIHLFRDGRDVAKSFQSKRWNGRWLHDNTQEWNEAMDFNLRWSRTELAKHFLQVRYEDLVLDTEATMRRICDFLEEQFEPAMLTWQEKVDDLVPGREAAIHERLKDIPSATDTYRWKREMTAREILVSEAFMGRHLRAHGYELHFSSPAWNPLLFLTRWYCLRALPALGLCLRTLRGLPQRLSGRSTRVRAEP
ncbi:MAG TPA: sulfotransferase [Rhizomicrobium sp.]|nr:sulfotransferase [Rhizomicrobium sp.]